MLALVLSMACPLFVQSLLSIRSVENGQLRLAWKSATSGVVLEEADSLSIGPRWQPSSLSFREQNGEWFVLLRPSSPSRFFRLRSAAPTTIVETSPPDGEEGVAVIRETRVRFSAPLAESTQLTTNHFYATFGGRRLLARIEH